MKKFAMAAVAAAAMSAGVAQAYTSGTFSNGFVVPNVIHNGATDTTVVGLVNQSGGTRAVYWTFFDQNSNHITDGCFPMTDKQFTGFNWSAQSGVGLAGRRGYLVFALGARSTTAAGAGNGQGDPLTACGPAAQLLVPTVAGAAAGTAVPAAGFTVPSAATVVQTPQLAANAFQVVTTGIQGVAFVPVIDGPLSLLNPVAPTAAAANTFAGTTTDLTTMGPLSLVQVAGAAQLRGTLVGIAANAVGTPGSNVLDNTLGGATTTTATGTNPQFSLRYFIDGAPGGNDTAINVWSTGDQRGTYTINAYDNAQNRKSVNFALANAELDAFNPETIPGLTATFTDGFLEWTPGAGLPTNAPSGAALTGNTLFANGGSIFSYSVITSSGFNAQQTLLGAHRN